MDEMLDEEVTRTQARAASLAMGVLICGALIGALAMVAGVVLGLVWVLGLL